MAAQNTIAGDQNDHHFHSGQVLPNGGDVNGDEGDP